MTELCRAQTTRAARPYRVVLLPDLFPEIRVNQLTAALREHGWHEGRDYVLMRSGFDLRNSAQPSNLFEDAVKRVLAEKPDLIVSFNTAYVIRIHRLTQSVPILVWGFGYPVEAGLANSLARPGKNVTGNSVYAGTGIWGKLLELLRDAKPGLKRVDVLWSYVPPAHPVEEIEPIYSELKQFATALGLEMRILEVPATEEWPRTRSLIEKNPPHAVLLTSGAPLVPLRAEVMKFTVEKRLPTIVDVPWGGTVPQPMLRYSPRPEELMRQIAPYFLRILAEGVKAGDLPIQQPLKFELAVDLKTAKAIGLSIPQSLLARADVVNN